MTARLVVAEEGADVSPALADLESASFEAPWSPDAIRALLQDGLTRVWVARENGRVVGAAMVRLVAGDGELLRVAVHPDARRRGVGQALLGVVLSAVADVSAHGIHLEVRASNAAARGLYARHGFVELGLRRGYYQAPREDAVLMHWQPTKRPGDDD